MSKNTSAKYSVGADMLSSASVYSEADKLWLKSSLDVDDVIGITELDDNFTFTVLLPFGSSIIMTCKEMEIEIEWFRLHKHSQEFASIITPHKTIH